MLLGLMVSVMVFLFVFPACAEENASDETEIPAVVVTGERFQPAGTGTLHLEQPSPTASRLGLTIRELPASIEVIDQPTIQERGLRTVSESIQAATGVTVGGLSWQSDELFYARIHEQPDSTAV